MRGKKHCEKDGERAVELFVVAFRLCETGFAVVKNVEVMTGQ